MALGNAFCVIPTYILFPPPNFLTRQEGHSFPTTEFLTRQEGHSFPTAEFPAKMEAYPFLASALFYKRGSVSIPNSAFSSGMRSKFWQAKTAFILRFPRVREP